MKIAIVGAGWYGCHIGKKLIELGLSVTIIDKQKEIFQAASLRDGLHNPRKCEI